MMPSSHKVAGPKGLDAVPTKKARKPTTPTSEKQDSRSGNLTQVILESISEGVFTIDDDWFVTSFNRAAEEITGVDREEAIGKHCWDVLRSNMCERNCALKRSMEQGGSFLDTATSIINSEQNRIPVVVCTSPLKDQDGRIVGGVETFRDMSMVEDLRRELEGRDQVGEMVSRSPLMHKIFRVLDQVALSDCTVLIGGETGTGKELMARTLHQRSHRSAKPFVAINCGALPESLLEAELFGYKAGAFTGAVKDKPGRFAQAAGGTILLDEIGDTTPAFQVRLLRVLQERRVQPLGGTEEEAVDVRILAASNKDLKHLISTGGFREDLFYRLNVVGLDLPALRQRKEDIPALVDSFITRINHLRGTEVSGINQEALALLMAYDFPGNIRELQNILEHATVLCPDGILEPHCLPEAFQPERRSLRPTDSMDEARQATEARIITQALKEHRYNKAATARSLGIHKATLYRKIKRLGLALTDKP